MPTQVKNTVEGFASCHDGRCAGYKQERVQVVVTETQFTYYDFGGDVPGVERSTFLVTFADEADVPCPACGADRFAADQQRPIYPNISGKPQDALLHLNESNERVRDVELDAAKREAEMAQMRALMERQQATLERQERMLSDLAEPPRRGPGRPRKETGE